MGWASDTVAAVVVIGASLARRGSGRLAPADRRRESRPQFKRADRVKFRVFY
jgi:hypothetical protein